jgi:acyl-CoA thioester hydrolase
MTALRLPVLWGHMDAMGHVNNTLYFRYFESARVEYMEQMGLFCDPENAVYPILASTKCDYKVPLTYPDTIIVTARTVKVGRTSFTQAYEITSTAKSTVAATGEGIVVCVDKATGKPVPVPDDMRVAIEKVEAQAHLDSERPVVQQIEILRRLPPQRRKELGDLTDEQLLARLTLDHPNAGPGELRRRIYTLLLGEELAERAYGPQWSGRPPGSSA